MTEPKTASSKDKHDLYRAAATAAMAQRFGARLDCVPSEEIHANLTIQVACDFGGDYAASVADVPHRHLPPREEEQLFDECVQRVTGSSLPAEKKESADYVRDLVCRSVKEYWTQIEAVVAAIQSGRIDWDRAKQVIVAQIEKQRQ